MKLVSPGTETGGKFPLSADELGPILARHELSLVSGWFSGSLLEVSVDDEKRRLEQQLATFAALGAPVMVYAETTGTVQNQQKHTIKSTADNGARTIF